jgi:hypothetical protein
VCPFICLFVKWKRLQCILGRKSYINSHFCVVTQRFNLRKTPLVLLPVVILPAFHYFYDVLPSFKPHHISSYSEICCNCETCIYLTNPNKIRINIKGDHICTEASTCEYMFNLTRLFYVEKMCILQITVLFYKIDFPPFTHFLQIF